MKISILVVSLNACDTIQKTINSILEQNYNDYEVIIKDGGSSDGCLRLIPNDERFKVYVRDDDGIYDAMNQAVSYANGDMGIFMNCGDCFFDDNVLKRVAEFVEKNKNAKTIYYGDCYTVNRNSVLRYPNTFDDYTCFTKVLCHQATFYPMHTLKSRGFSVQYKMAADYEYYVNAYINGYKMIHIPMIIVKYQGGGASETKDNRIRSLKEGNQIRKKYFIGRRYWKTYVKTLIKGIGIKHFFVTQEWFYPCYKKIAALYYKSKN